MFDINKCLIESKEKNSVLLRWNFSDVYQFYARCSDDDFRPRFFLPLAQQTSALFHVYFSGEISWKICRAGFIRCRSSRLMRSWPIVRFWWLLLFCYVLPKSKIRWIASISTRLVSQNKSGGHVTVRLCDDWYFFDVLLRNKIRDFYHF